MSKMKHEHEYTQMNTNTWMSIDQEDGVDRKQHTQHNAVHRLKMRGSTLDELKAVG